jgi:uncharacterized protein DUF2735
MTTSLNQGSARIYQFPAGGRAALDGRNYPARTAADLGASRVNETVSSGSWYHDAAIQESKPVGEH